MSLTRNSVYDRTCGAGRLNVQEVGSEGPPCFRLLEEAEAKVVVLVFWRTQKQEDYVFCYLHLERV
jgi:hypothetical protein